MGDEAVKTRMAWADAGRGLAITLVVLLHAQEFFSTAGNEMPALAQFNETAHYIRMPLFFVLSGLFAQKWIAASWSRLWSGKISLLYWVYLVWSFIGVPFALWIRAQLSKGQIDVSSELWAAVLLPVRPTTMMWFVWTLSLFFVVAKVIRLLPPAVQLGGAALLAVAYSSIPDDLLATLHRTTAFGYTGFLAYFFFFLVGLHGRDLIVRLAHAPMLARGSAAAIAACALTLEAAIPSFTDHAGASFMIRCVALPGAIALSTFVARLTPLTYIGSRTLPIYVSHGITIGLVAGAASLITAGPALPRLDAPAVVVCAVVCIAVGLGLEQLTKTRLTWLLAQPRWFAHGPARRSQPASMLG
ncbi:acyltransferase family protein [Demequina iriomotensis]|uniref:acyltransferase family protein n=1 Tax=Demequina iriomotensis TaxID=1536641 RepID=UPI0007841064|nr:acyltransferase family protein [Demequina iriomotensis]